MAKKPLKVDPPFPSIWKSVVGMTSAQLELQKLVPETDYDRLDEWAKHRADTGVQAYVHFLEFAKQSILDGYSVEDILNSE